MVNAKVHRLQEDLVGYFADACKPAIYFYSSCTEGSGKLLPIATEVERTEEDAPFGFSRHAEAAWSLEFDSTR